MNDKRDRAAVIAPPPLLAALCIGAGFVADHFRGLAIFPEMGRPQLLFASTLILLASAFILSGLLQMVRQKEDPNPYKPTRSIVTGGIYRFTRNPIYLGLLTIAVAIATYANSAWLLLSAVALFLALEFGVVRPEERYLSAKFGDTYDEYRRRVRRWI